MNRKESAIAALFLFAVFSLVWRQGNIFILPLPKAFEMLVFILSAWLGYEFAVSPEKRALLKVTLSGLRVYNFVLAALIISPALGLFYSAWTGLPWQAYALQAGVEYLRIAFAVFLFYFASYLVLRIPKLLPWGLMTIAVSPLVLWVGLVPRWQELFLTEWRLRGAGNDPNYLATWLVISILISLSFFLYEDRRRGWWLANAAAVAPLALWTGSRGAWLILALGGLVLLGKYFSEEFSLERLRRGVILILAAFLGSALGFLALPPMSKVMIIDRGPSVFISDATRTSWTSFFANQNAGTFGGTELQLNFKFLGYGQDRQSLWRKAVPMILSSPFGYGPSYYEWSPVDIQANGGRKLGPHDLWLETALTGGWLGFSALIALVLVSGRKAIKLLFGRHSISSALGLAWFALLGLSLFLDMLTLRWLWLLTAFIAVFPEGPERAFVGFYFKKAKASLTRT